MKYEKNENLSAGNKVRVYILFITLGYNNAKERCCNKKQLETKTILGYFGTFLKGENRNLWKFGVRLRLKRKT